MEKLLAVAKPFVSKLQSRPVLTGALVTNEHIIATDSHVLIRIKHHQEIELSYWHDFSKNPMDFAPSYYPEVSRLFPEASRATFETRVDVNEFLAAHKLALVAAKANDKDKKIVRLADETLSVILGNTFESIGFTHHFGKKMFNDLIHYNCDYMIKAMQAFKKMKDKEVTILFFGINRPMLLLGKDTEIILLPIRVG